MVQSIKTPVHRPALFAFLLALTSVLAGCGPGEPALETLPRNLLSPVVRDAVELQERLLAAEAPPAPAADDVRAYFDLREALQNARTRAAAADTFFALWTAEPEHFLWIEVACLLQDELQDPDRFDRLYDHAAGQDTTRAVAHYLHARYWWGWEPGAEQRFYAAAAADSAASQLDDLQRLWLASRLALTESLAGRDLAALARLGATLAQAWQVGGPPLAAAWWRDISVYSRNLGRLDDALQAALVATELARRDGHAVLEIRGRLAAGRVHEVRCEFASARAIYREVEALSRTHDHIRWQREALEQQAEIAGAQGRWHDALDLHRHALDIALAHADTGAAITDCFLLSNDHRHLGRLDSTRTWLDRAAHLDTVGTPQGRGDQVAMFWIGYFSQLGRYARADSIRAALGDDLDPALERVIVLELIEESLDAGRPDRVYRHLDDARRNPSFQVRQGTYDPRLDLAHLAARFHASQGEFAEADREIALAAERIAAGSTLFARFDHELAAGRVAELAGDPHTAAGRYRQALALAAEMADPNLQNRSRVRLGQVLVRLGELDEARTLFVETRDVPEYWTRLASALLLGMTETAAGAPDQALAQLDAAQAMLRPDAPHDVRARLRLERGRALAALDRPEEALAELRAIALGPGRGRRGPANEILRAFDRPLHREVAEAVIALLHDHPQLAGRHGVALETLAHAEAARWRLDPDGPEPTAALLADLDLDEGTAAACFFPGEARSFAWYGSTTGWSLREIADPATLRRLTEAVLTDTAAPDRAFQRADAEGLAAILLGPIRDAWLPGHALLVSAPGTLATIPWPALPLGPDTLVLDHGPVIHLASLTTLARGPRRTTGHLLAVGVNAGGDDPTLAHAEAEARAIAALWPDGEATVLTGDGASWPALQRLDLAAYGILHVASHARFSEGLPGHATLRLAETGSAQPLTIPEVSELDLSAELVFLSCCEGAGTGRTTGSGLDSFARAFLRAGAGSVIASTHRVDDRAARELALLFYRHWLTGKERAASLQAAQSDLRRLHPEWEHPFYWGHYQLHAVLATGS